MRVGFVLLRFACYVGVFAMLAAGHHFQLWQWILSVACMVWAISEHFKRPNDSYHIVRLGAWIELAFIVICSIALHSNIILFLAVSPIVRSDVHLFCRDAGVMGAVTGCAILVEAFTVPSGSWTPWLEAIVIGGLGLHGFFLGSLLRERERLSRLEQLALQERASRVRDEERMKLTGQLHDVMGQYWTAVIRGLDAVARTSGEQQHELIDKVQTMAAKGLAEMRAAVHDGYDGRHSCDQWIEMLMDAIWQWREVVGIDVNYQVDPVDWHRFPNPEMVAEVTVRIAMEAMTNAIRHTDPVRLDVSVTQTTETLAVAVRDVTRQSKWTRAASTSEGMGTREMDRLATQVSGLFSRETTRSGTVVRLIVPFLHQQSSQPEIQERGEIV